MPTRRLLSSLLVASVLWLSSMSRAHAQEMVLPNAPGPAFGSPGGEAALTIASVLTLTTTLIPQNSTSWGPSPARAHHEAYSVASDFTGASIGTGWALVAGYGLETAYFMENGVDDPFGRGIRVALIDVQSGFIATGIAFALKRLTGRCRPRDWVDGACRPGAKRNSFPSGHVTPVASVAGAHFMLALRSDASSAQRWVAFGAAEAMSVATAFLRVLAGAHSWEDVVAGWAVGHATGTLVSYAHPMRAVPPGAGVARLGLAGASTPTSPLMAPPPVQINIRGRF